MSAQSEARQYLRRLEAEGHVGDSRQCPTCMQPRPCRWQNAHRIITSLLPAKPR